MKYKAGDKVTWSEGSFGEIKLKGTLVVGIIDEFTGDTCYLIDVAGRQIMKDEKEIEASSSPAEHG